MIKGEIYATKADIWSIGVVLYLLLFGHCPFEGKSVAKLIHKIEYEDLAFPQYPKIFSHTVKAIETNFGQGLQEPNRLEGNILIHHNRKRIDLSSWIFSPVFDGEAFAYKGL